MKFKDPELQQKLEQLNREGLTFDGLVQDLNIARTALLAMLTEQPTDKVAFAKDVTNIVSQLSRAGDQLLKTAEKLKLIVSKEQMEAFRDEWIKSFRDAVVEETDQGTFTRIVDRWVAESKEILAA